MEYWEFGDLIIRRIDKRKDIKKVARVAERAFRGKPDVYWATVGAIRAQRTYVAEINREIIGVVEIETINLSSGRHGHIGYIFVDPDYWRRGIGSKLIDVAEWFFRSKGAIKAWALTSPENIPTRKLFAKKGYVEISKAEVFKELGERDARKLLRRMIYWEGDVILKKELV